MKDQRKEEDEWRSKEVFGRISLNEKNGGKMSQGRRLKRRDEAVGRVEDEGGKRMRRGIYWNKEREGCWRIGWRRMKEEC